jgi:hypothetical protein
VLRAALAFAVFVVLLSPFATSDQGLRDALAGRISGTYAGFRLATSDDFSPKLPVNQHGQVFVQTDFNRDGQIDAGVLVINPRVQEYRIYLALGGQEKLQLLFSRKWTLSDGHPIRTPMFLKPAGDAGPAHRHYSVLTGAETAAYTAVPAIELWSGQYHDERDTNAEQLSYCSMTWYYDRGQLRNFQVCD